MYFQQSEHNPPHIHALYAEYVAAVRIKDGTVLEENLPKKALSMVQEWILLNRNELLEMWETQEFQVLPPLK